MNNNMSWLNLGNYINPKARNTELSNDYNQLTNRPIITLTGTSQNPIKLWKLDVGLYILNGYVQHTDTLLSEARGLFVSATVGIVGGKYVMSAFIPFWEGQYEYILPSLSSETYTEHQMIRMITQGNSLTLDNIREYTPSEEYHPSTKKYVDDTIEIMKNELGKMGLNNNDIQSLMKENRRRDIAIQALLSQNSDKMVTIDEEVHNISMDYSLDEGIATINTLEGDTLVNVSKDTEYDKILSYEQDIVENTNTVDLEVDGNLNPIIVGDTLVNVCTQNNPTAITNEYTVEGSNHFALQDKAEGNCRPIIQGNTLVNRSKTKDSTPLTTYVSEVEGNKMSLVDDTDTHVRVDKLVGDTMVNLVQAKNLDLYHFSGNASFTRTMNGKFCIYESTLDAESINNGYFTIKTKAHTLMKADTSYTIIFTIKENTLPLNYGGISVRGVRDAFYGTGVRNQIYLDNSFLPTVGTHKIVITLPSDITSYDGLGIGFPLLDNYFIYGSFRFVIGEVMIFEGDLTQTPELIPQEYFEGLKNSYEDGYIPNDVWCNYNKAEVSTSNVMSTITSEHSFEYKAQSSYSDNISPANILNILNLKTEMTYTFIGKVNAQCTIDIIYNENISMNESIIFQPNIPTTFLFKTPQSYNRICMRLLSTDISVRSITFSDIILLEGDYTSNPPTYNEVMEHGGQYRCEVEVQGKNLFDGIWELGSVNGTNGLDLDNPEALRSSYIELDYNKSYYLSNLNAEYMSLIAFYDENKQYIGRTIGTYRNVCSFNKNTVLFNNKILNCYKYIRFTQYSTITDIDNFINTNSIQLEEGDTVTAYEPYYNQTQTVYLNSPLLKGDEVVYKEGKLCHYHKMGKVVLDGSEDENWYGSDSYDTTQPRYWIIHSFGAGEKAKVGSDVTSQQISDKMLVANPYSAEYTKDCCCILADSIRIRKNEFVGNLDGFKQWLQANPTTVVYELANPYYETISTSELLLPITTNCKLLTSSNIPLTTMSTRVFTEEVNILANTQYSLNFNSDVASTVNITLGGTVLSNQEIVKGYNKLSITTPSTLVDKNSLLIIEGSGVNISEVVVTEYDEGVCEYIEGLKSSFEDGWIPSEEDNLINIPNVYLNNQTSVVRFRDVQNYLLKDKLYTLSYIIGEDTSNMNGALFRLSLNGNFFVSVVSTYKIGRNTISFKMPYDISCYFEFWNRDKGIINISDIIILEGDWTHLTEEDFNHLGQYKVEYKVVGKNKFKGELINNKYSSQDDVCERVNNQDGSYNIIPQNVIQNYFSGVLNVNVIPNKTYKISYKVDNVLVTPSVYVYKGFNNVRNTSMQIASTGNYGKFTVPKGVTQISVGLHYNKLTEPYTISDIQLEEGTVATEYEPYKESIQTVYLNSPLLEGDTIEEINGEVYHVHRRYMSIFGSDSYWSQVTDLGNVIRFQQRTKYPATNTKVIANQFGKYHTDYNGNWEHYYIWNNQLYIFVRKYKLISYNIGGLRQLLQENPLIIVYELENPTYELIPSSSIVCKSYPNGHLDFDTNVHINNTVNFVKANLPITYANTSTNYKLQFVSDKDMENVTINALGNIMENVTMNKGLNKISFTSPSDATNILTFEGLGYAYISNVQLVATEKDIDYFKGLYSTYECGLIEDESNENYGKYEVNIVSYNAPIQFGKGGKIE